MDSEIECSAHPLLLANPTHSSADCNYSPAHVCNSHTYEAINEPVILVWFEIVRGIPKLNGTNDCYSTNVGSSASVESDSEAFEVRASKDYEVNAEV